MLNLEHIERYRADGYLLIERLLDPDAIAGLRHVTDDFVESSRAVTASDDVYDLDPSHRAEAQLLRCPRIVLGVGRAEDPCRRCDEFGRAHGVVKASGHAFVRKQELNHPYIGTVDPVVTKWACKNIHEQTEFNLRIRQASVIKCDRCMERLSPQFSFDRDQRRGNECLLFG